MNKTINVSLSTESVAEAIRQLKAYKKWLERKADQLRERVAYFIAKDASAVFNTATAEALIGEGAQTGNVEVVVDDRGDFTLVIANGEDAIFMEFGAGVYANGPVGQSPNPLPIATEMGWTIGSYGKGNGRKMVWGFKDADGQLHLTRGTPASMPMYKAITAVVDDLEQIAKEAFSSND